MFKSTSGPFQPLGTKSPKLPSSIGSNTSLESDISSGPSANRLSKIFTHIANELLESERRFVDDLRFVVMNYMKYFEGNDRVPPGLVGKRPLIFANWETIYRFHERIFLVDMESRELTPSAIGELFCEYEQDFEALAEFCRIQICSTRQQITADADSFSKTKNVCLPASETGLTSYLSKPFKRLVAYKSILDRIIKETSTGSTDHVDLRILQVASDKMDFFLHHANDLAYQDLIRHHSIPLIQQGRLLRQNEMMINIEEEFAVGIDLGTSNSCVVVYRYDRLETIAETTMGARAIPSCIAFDQTGPSTELLFGVAAKNHQKREPHHCIYNVKRIIGKQFDDKEVQMEKEIVSYGITNEDGYPRIRVKERGNFVEYSPEEISSMILSYLKHTTEEFLGSEVKSAVITVPANFNDAQRKATKLAAEMAGLKVLRMLNEPTAAAMAYGADLQGRQNLLVFDFGGGTLDVSILEVQDAKNLRVKATAGNMRLGGEDIDQRIVNHMLQVIREQHKFDASRDEKIKSRLRAECETVKRQLSASTQKRITIPNLLGTGNFTTNFTRTELERLCADLFEKVLEPVDEALRSAQMTQRDISHIILAGGSSHIPKVRELLANYFPNAPLRNSIDPSEAVAKGAALLATSIALCGANTDIRLEDVTPLTLGVNVFGGDMSQLIPKGSPLPTENHQIYTTFKDNQTYIDIDVFEGEHPKSKQNHYLGNFKFSGIRPAPKGKANILISFSVDLSGILMVTASGGTNKMSMVFRENREPPLAIGSSPPNNVNTAQARSRLQRKVENARRDIARDQDEFRQIRVDMLAQWLDATKDLACTLRQYERWSRILQVIFPNAHSVKAETTETASNGDHNSAPKRTEPASANARLSNLAQSTLPSGEHGSTGPYQSQHENLTLLFTAEADVKYCESTVQDPFKSTILIYENTASATEKFLCILHSKTQKELFFVKIVPGMVTQDRAKFNINLDKNARLRIQFTAAGAAEDFVNWIVTYNYPDLALNQMKGGTSF